MSEPEWLGGSFLISDANLSDPNFRRTVVLIISHDENGALGLIVNRKLDAVLSDAMPDFADTEPGKLPIFEGGPVQRETALGLTHRPRTEASDTWHPVLGCVGLVDISLSPEEIGGVDEARVFSGYAGWGEGQLEMELAVGSWIPVAATVDDAFDPVPTTLWRRVLKRQGGEVARYATYPDDPRMN